MLTVGTVEITPRIVAAFWDRVDRGDPAVCWEWTGYKEATGYGRYGQYKINAHRLAYAIANRVSLEGGRRGPVIRHICDNPSCVNPAHLEIGTQRDNVKDAVDRGRRDDRRGERNPAAKLTAAQVAQIRRDYKPGRYGYGRLARDYGVTKGAIQRILAMGGWEVG